MGSEPHFVLVYPKVVPLEGYDLASRRPIGEVLLTHRLFEDPTRIAGVRGYEPGDPLNRIHWKATARTGSLHSKIHEPSTLSGATVAYLRAQVEAGAQAIQVFDSWAGALDPDDYARHVLPVMRDVFGGVAGLGVPLIHFGVGTGELLAYMRDAGATVVGVDWRVPLDRAWDRVGPDVAVQGNLDPAACVAPWEVVEAKAMDVLARAAGRPGHVFNLDTASCPGRRRKRWSGWVSSAWIITEFHSCGPLCRDKRGRRCHSGLFTRGCHT